MQHYYLQTVQNSIHLVNSKTMNKLFVIRSQTWVIKFQKFSYNHVYQTFIFNDELFEIMATIFQYFFRNVIINDYNTIVP